MSILKLITFCKENFNDRSDVRLDFNLWVEEKSKSPDTLFVSPFNYRGEFVIKLDNDDIKYLYDKYLNEVEIEKQRKIKEVEKEYETI